jgi:hypothetical protein
MLFCPAKRMKKWGESKKGTNNSTTKEGLTRIGAKSLCVRGGDILGGGRYGSFKQFSLWDVRGVRLLSRARELRKLGGNFLFWRTLLVRVGGIYSHLSPIKKNNIFIFRYKRLKNCFFLIGAKNPQRYYSQDIYFLSSPIHSNSIFSKFQSDDGLINFQKLTKFSNFVN